MNLRLAALTAGFVLACSLAAPSAPEKPTAAMMRPVQALLTALNTNDVTPARSAFTPNATIVDEYAPFRWSGPSAASAYLSAFGSMMKSAKISAVHGTLGKVTAFDHTAGRAYLVVATDVAARMNGKPFTEHGTWTFTLQQSGSRWLIDSVAWGTVSGGP